MVMIGFRESQPGAPFYTRPAAAGGNRPSINKGMWGRRSYASKVGSWWGRHGERRCWTEAKVGRECGERTAAAVVGPARLDWGEGFWGLRGGWRGAGALEGGRFGCVRALAGAVAERVP